MQVFQNRGKNPKSETLLVPGIVNKGSWTFVSAGWGPEGHISLTGIVSAPAPDSSQAAYKILFPPFEF